METRPGRTGGSTTPGRPSGRNLRSGSSSSTPRSLAAHSVGALEADPTSRARAVTIAALRPSRTCVRMPRRPSGRPRASAARAQRAGRRGPAGLFPTTHTTSWRDPTATGPTSWSTPAQSTTSRSSGSSRSSRSRVSCTGSRDSMATSFSVTPSSRTHQAASRAASASVERPAVPDRPASIRSDGGPPARRVHRG